MRHILKYLIFIISFFWGCLSYAEDLKLNNNVSVNTKKWTDDIKVNGFFSGGTALNPNLPFNGINWGQYNTDRANTPQFNQSILTAVRQVDIYSNKLDYGFKFQGMVGTDARYAQYLGQTEYLIPSRTQFTMIEANVVVHLPILFQNGIDLKIGEFASHNGFEDPPSNENIFYTHSYSYNFGPFVDTGIMGITHLNDWLDIYTGIITGVDTTIGWPGDNNNSPSIHGGFISNFFDKKLQIEGMTHSGPQNPYVTDPHYVGWPNGVVGGIPAQCACNPNNAWRFFNNIVVIWKPDDKWMLASDISYYKESGWNPISKTGLPDYTINALADVYNFNPAILPQRPQGADAYGIANYITYQLTDVVKLAASAEFWRDNKNFFANAYPGYFDNVNQAHGYPAPSVIIRPQGQGTSYLALTAGVNIKPKIDNIPYFKEVLFRPEVRWDTSFNGAKPFFGSNGMIGTQKLIAMDVILPFSVK